MSKSLRTPFMYWRDWVHPIRTIVEHRQARSYERQVTGGMSNEELLAWHRSCAENAPRVTVRATPPPTRTED